MAVVKDWRGNEIKVGSTVVYPARQSSSLWMNEGVVETIDEYESRFGRTVRIGVRKTGGTGYRKDASGRIAYPDPDRITVVS